MREVDQAAILGKLATHFDVPPPTLHDSAEWAVAYSHDRHVRIYPDAPECIVLHEFAHHLCEERLQGRIKRARDSDTRQGWREAGRLEQRLEHRHRADYFDALVEVVGFWYEGDLTKYPWQFEYCVLRRRWAKLRAESRPEVPDSQTSAKTA